MACASIPMTRANITMTCAKANREAKHTPVKTLTMGLLLSENARRAENPANCLTSIPSQPARSSTLRLASFLFPLGMGDDAEDTRRTPKGVTGITDTKRGETRDVVSPFIAIYIVLYLYI